jgi:rubrerythrin
MYSWKASKKYHATWWECKECGFRFLRLKHEPKSCPLCESEAEYSHLVLLNRRDWNRR